MFSRTDLNNRHDLEGKMCMFIIPFKNKKFLTTNHMHTMQQSNFNISVFNPVEKHVFREDVSLAAGSGQSHITFTPLTFEEDESPAGGLVAMDAEFVTLNQVRILLKCTKLFIIFCNKFTKVCQICNEFTKMYQFVYNFCN